MINLGSLNIDTHGVDVLLDPVTCQYLSVPSVNKLIAECNRIDPRENSK